MADHPRSNARPGRARGRAGRAGGRDRRRGPRRAAGRRRGARRARRRALLAGAGRRPGGARWPARCSSWLPRWPSGAGGRGRRSAPGRRLCSPAGAGAAAAAAAVVSATALRHNRFLAAGLTALAAVGRGAGRARSWRRRWRGSLGGRAAAPDAARLPSADPPGAGRWRCSVRCCVAVAGRVVFARAWPTRAPLRGDALVRARALVGRRRVPAAGRGCARRVDAALAGPLARGRRSWRRASSARRPWSRSACRWADNLRFAPWIDIGVGAAIAVAGRRALALAAARRLPRRARRTAAAGGRRRRRLRRSSCCARRAVRAGAQGRRARARRWSGRRWRRGGRLLDFDRDGYARVLGGGDCDDGDPDVHPGAVDLPGDGIDADCDGHDATRRAAAAGDDGRAAGGGAARSQRPPGHHRHAARRPPRLLRLRAPDLAGDRRAGRRRARCSRTAGRTRRRRATRCRRSPPGAGRRRSPGTSRSGGRASAATCARSPRRCTTPATSPAGCSASATSRIADHRGFERGMDSTAPTAPCCTSRSTGRWSRAARRRAR